MKIPKCCILIILMMMLLVPFIFQGFYSVAVLNNRNSTDADGEKDQHGFSDNLKISNGPVINGPQPTNPLGDVESFEGQYYTDLEIGYNLTMNESRFALDYDGLTAGAESQLQVPVGGFNMTRSNFSFYGPYTETTFDVEMDHKPFSLDYILPELDDPAEIETTESTVYGMSFQVNSTTEYVVELSLLLNVPLPLNEEIIQAWIYNSTIVASKVVPDSPLDLMVGERVLSVGDSWVNFTGQVYLNASQTTSNTFYVVPFVLRQMVAISVVWNHADDNKIPDRVDDGNAVERVGGIWDLFNDDFTLMGIKVWNSRRASSIKLTINGTEVQDQNIGGRWGGSWNNASIFPSISDGSVYYNFSSNSTKRIYLTKLLFDGTAINFTWARTIVLASGLDPIALWNVSMPNIFYPNISSTEDLGSGASKGVEVEETFVNVTVSSNWTVEDCMYENGTSVGSWTETPYGDERFVSFLATNASYVVNCTSLNFLKTIQVFNASDVVKTPYATMYLNDTMEINGTFSISGSQPAQLWVFSDPLLNSSIYSAQQNLSGDSVQFTGRLADYTYHNGTYWMKVAFFNGTHVGMNYTSIYCELFITNLTLLDYDPVPALVDPGTKVSALVHYNMSNLDFNITGADIQTSWPAIYGGYNTTEMGNGQYNVTFFTAGAPAGIQRVNITAISWGYENANLEFQFNITGGFNTTLNFIKFYVTDNGKNWTAPDPFFDDEKPIRIEFTNLTNGAPLHGAYIISSPSWRADPLLFSDLYYTLGEPYDGQYDIRVDTTDLSSEQTVYVDFSIFLPNYQSQQARFWINVTRVNSTYLELFTTGYDLLECYEGESVKIAASYYDHYHSAPILFSTPEEGNLTWKITGVVDVPQPMSLSILEYRDYIDVPTHGIAPGYYNVTIETVAALNYVNFSKNVTLHVLDNLNTTITYEVIPAGEIREGAIITLIANLTSENGSLIERVPNTIIEFENLNTSDTHSAITNENGTAFWSGILVTPQAVLQITMNYSGTPQIDNATNVTNYPVLPKFNASLTLTVQEYGQPYLMVGDDIHVQVYLINNETSAPISGGHVIITLSYGAQELNVSIYTGADGTAATTITIPPEAGAAGSIAITAWFAGKGTISSCSCPVFFTITVETIEGLILKNIWWVLLIIAAIMGSILALQFGYRRPKKRRRIRMKTKVAQKIDDVQNIEHLAIIHSGTGAAIYSQSMGTEINQDLISGFLTAISAFQSEIGIKKKDKEEITRAGFELSYADFQILLNNSPKGTCRSAFIVKESPSQEFRQHAQEFLKTFEERFEADLLEWDGNLKIFKPAETILGDHFAMKYDAKLQVLPPERRKRKRLSELERVVCHVAERIQQRMGIFFISELITRLENAREEPRYELLYAINQLLEKEVCIYTESTRVSTPRVEARPEEALMEEAPIMKAPPTKPPSQVSATDDIISRLKVENLTFEEIEFLRLEISSMEEISRDLLVHTLLTYPPEVRIKSLHHIIGIRTRKNEELTALLEDAEKQIAENRGFEALQTLNRSRKLFEDLGKVKIANTVTQQIRTLMNELKDTTIISEMRQEAAQIQLEAEILVAKQRFLEAAVEFQKAARLYTQVGDDERARQNKMLAKDVKAKAPPLI